jgi:hypothetical protein
MKYRKLIGGLSRARMLVPNDLAATIMDASDEQAIRSL